MKSKKVGNFDLAKIQEDPVAGNQSGLRKSYRVIAMVSSDYGIYVEHFSLSIAFFFNPSGLGIKSQKVIAIRILFSDLCRTGWVFLFSSH